MDGPVLTGIQMQFENEVTSPVIQLSLNKVKDNEFNQEIDFRGRRVTQIQSFHLGEGRKLAGMNFKFDSGETKMTIGSPHLYGKTVSKNIESGHLIGFYGVILPKTGGMLDHFGFIMRD